MVYSQNTTQEMLNAWLDMLVQKGEEGDILVRNRARFHEEKFIKKWAEDHGFILLLLPPYSPDFNPIEHYWGHRKRWLRGNRDRFDSLDLGLDFFFKYEC